MKTGEELREMVLDILQKHYYGRNILERRCADDLMELINSELYEAYQDGAVAAQSTACAEIVNNYVPILRG